MYINRTALSKTIHNLSDTFKVLLLTGPRQAGKSTLLKQCSSIKNYKYVSLENFDDRDLALSDPALFFQKYPPPVIVEEIQYAPNLLNQIKIIVDRSDTNGMFWLTGSQKFSLMQGVSESLAGRVGIIELYGMCLSEILFPNKDYCFPVDGSDEWLDKIKPKENINFDLSDVYKTIWRGSFPLIALNDQINRDIFYESYIQTYISRDSKLMLKVDNEITFYRFLRAMSSRTSQLLNYAEVAKELQVDLKTIKSWVSVLEKSGIIMLLEPYFSNLTSRLTKTPKLYFVDTGLCSYLSKWPSYGTLESGAMSGAILENFVVSEVVKSYSIQGMRPLMYFYRDKDQNEVDILLESGDELTPIEIKKSATPSLHTLKNKNFLSKLNKKINRGIVFCLRENSIPLSKDVVAVPIKCI